KVPNGIYVGAIDSRRVVDVQLALRKRIWKLVLGRQPDHLEVLDCVDIQGHAVLGQVQAETIATVKVGLVVLAHAPGRIALRRPSLAAVNALSVGVLPK